jgi:cytochrome d ubiquinol oxidase subunit I
MSDSGLTEHRKKRHLLLLLAVLAFFAFSSLITSPLFNCGEVLAASETIYEDVREGAEAAGVVHTPLSIAAPKLKEADYPKVLGLNSRITVWLISQLHLYFGAFVLAVPIFVLIIEGLGVATKDERYDKIAYEFIKISITAYSLTALFGGLLVFVFMTMYPDLFRYLASVFDSSMIFYALLFFGESACLYIYYYGWYRFDSGFKKWIHMSIGLLLNGFGMTLMVIANGWTAFMMSPSGLDETGALTGSIWAALQNHLWNPLNLHRFISNIVFGGGIVGAYAAYKFLSSTSDEERGYYDWMGYTANIIAVVSLLPLPFAGYWFTAEVYAFSQQMGIVSMGGPLAWLFIIQAVLIGALFLSENYYLWCGMSRAEGEGGENKLIPLIAFIVAVCFIVWLTPHTIVSTPAERQAMGGAYHPDLTPLGLMPAKNTAVNYLIIYTFLSFILYRRRGRVPVVSWADSGNTVIAAVFVMASLNILGAGVYGNYVPTTYKIGSSVPQVASTLTVLIVVMIIDVLMYRGAKTTGVVRWGAVPSRSQYALILLAVAFTWLMGLMGYVRSAMRQEWHVYGVMRDMSEDAYIPEIGSAMNTVSVSVIIFMLLIVFVFWIAQFGEKKEAEV